MLMHVNLDDLFKLLYSIPFSKYYFKKKICSPGEGQQAVFFFLRLTLWHKQYFSLFVDKFKSFCRVLVPFEYFFCFKPILFPLYFENIYLDL